MHGRIEIVGAGSESVESRDGGGDGVGACVAAVEDMTFEGLWEGGVAVCGW